MRLFFALSIALFLAGCAVASKQDVQGASDTTVCKKIGFFNKPIYTEQLRPWWDEARRRELFTQKEIDSLQPRKIYIGMRKCAMYAAWGEPERENRSVGSWGVRIQHVYGRQYVYTSDGVITSFQD